MHIESIYPKLMSLFGDGLVTKYATIKMPPDCRTITTVHEDGLRISFPDKCPTLKVTKVITLTLSLTAINIGKDGGVLEISRFPDIPFSFDDISEMLKEFS